MAKPIYFAARFSKTQENLTPMQRERVIDIILALPELQETHTATVAMVSASCMEARFMKIGAIFAGDRFYVSIRMKSFYST